MIILFMFMNIDFIFLDDDMEVNDLFIAIRMLIEFKSNYFIDCNNSWIEDNCIFIQTELCSQSLEKFIERKNEIFIDQTTVAMICIDFYISYELLRELLQCVQYLHQTIDIDWTLSPENIMISNNIINGKCIKIDIVNHLNNKQGGFY